VEYIYRFGVNMVTDLKFKNSIKDLEHALTFVSKASSDKFYLSGISKSFEVCLEYLWKHLKQAIEEEGLEAYSPKEIVKTAAKAGLVDEAEFLIECINARNSAVHDYFGTDPKEYLALIGKFATRVKAFL